jgi:hypothetical protein
MSVTIPRVIGFAFVAAFCVSVALVSGHRSAPSASANLVIWGDPDCNGSVAPRDGQAILNHFLGKAELSQTPPCPAVGATVTIDGMSHVWGDPDCNGSVAPRDGQAILNHFLGKAELSQTPPCPAVGSTVTLGAGSSPTAAPTPTSGVWSASNFHWHEALPNNLCDLTKPIPPGSPFIVGLCATFDLQIPDANYTLRTVWKRNGTTFADNSYPNIRLYAGNWSSSLTGVQQSGTYSLTEYANGVLLGTGQIVIAVSTTPAPTPPPASANYFCWVAIFSNDLVNGVVSGSQSCYPPLGPSYFCMAIGTILVNCDGTYPAGDYSCTVIGIIGDCNADYSSGYPNYSCTKIGSFVDCSTFVSGWPDFNCYVSSSTAISCTSNYYLNPSFACNRVGIIYSCY